MTRPTRAHHRPLAAIVTAVLVMASCSGDDDEAGADEESITTTAVETTAPPTTLSVEEELEAAFFELEAVLTDLAAAPNPDDTRLPELVIDPLLSEYVDGLTQRQLQNQIIEIGDLTSNEVVGTTVASTGGTATVLVCSVGDDTVVDKDTGDVVAEGTYTNRNELSYRNRDGQWMLEDLDTLKTWEGVEECDA